MSEQSLKEVAVNHDDIEKLETALDYIMYVARTGGHVFMPEDKKDFKPFLLSEIKRFLNEVIEDCIQENPEGAEIYKLKPTEETQWKSERNPIERLGLGVSVMLTKLTFIYRR